MAIRKKKHCHLSYPRKRGGRVAQSHNQRQQLRGNQKKRHDLKNTNLLRCHNIAKLIVRSPIVGIITLLLVGICVLWLTLSYSIYKNNENQHETIIKLIETNYKIKQR